MIGPERTRGADRQPVYCEPIRECSVGRPFPTGIASPKSRARESLMQPMRSHEAVESRSRAECQQQNQNQCRDRHTPPRMFPCVTGNRKSFPHFLSAPRIQQYNRRGVPIGGYPSPPVKLILPLASIDQVKKMIAAQSRRTSKPDRSTRPVGSSSRQYRSWGMCLSPGLSQHT